MLTTLCVAIPYILPHSTDHNLRTILLLCWKTKIQPLFERRLIYLPTFRFDKTRRPFSFGEKLLRIQGHWSAFIRHGGDAIECPSKIDGDERTNHQEDERCYTAPTFTLGRW